MHGEHELPSKAYDFSLQAYLLERGSVGDFSKSYLDFNSADYDSRMDWENKGNLLRKEYNKRRRLCQMNMKQFPIVYSFMQNVIILHNQRHLQIDRLVKIKSIFLDLLMNLPNIPVSKKCFYFDKAKQIIQEESKNQVQNNSASVLCLLSNAIKRRGKEFSIKYQEEILEDYNTELKKWLQSAKEKESCSDSLEAHFRNQSTVK
ncbi:hypothetical protein O9G_000319 [Rozella allomycis CSF55]|uniref:Uncharacterized protein n=1 Tax=Rozella allomycis (strain CSF55) TaxID=988480 RepID=A0A075ASY6_ROZAC|nr:hypothetical protein O9G_000319 [Rozella allomycis CSF55]|eukprot:EPZ31840.1 hypothetical protein O9G_000319 [Rozella allomycis CSF55]